MLHVCQHIIHPLPTNTRPPVYLLSLAPKNFLHRHTAGSLPKGTSNAGPKPRIRPPVHQLQSSALVKQCYWLRYCRQTTPTSSKLIHTTKYVICSNTYKNTIMVCAPISFNKCHDCAVGTQNLQLLHKSSICINNGKPIRHFITTTWIVRLLFRLITCI
jgi:hypothetical protein